MTHFSVGSLPTIVILLMLSCGCTPSEVRSNKTLDDLGEFLKNSGLMSGSLEKHPQLSLSRDVAPGLIEEGEFKDLQSPTPQTVGRFFSMCYRFDTSANASKYVEHYKKTRLGTDYEARQNGPFVIVDCIRLNQGGVALKALRAFQP